MEKKEESLPTNEQVIDDLTKDLEGSWINEDQNAKEGSSKDDDRHFKVTPDPDDNETDKNEPPPQAEDYIDEERLKDREIELTDEEKEVCYYY